MRTMFQLGWQQSKWAPKLGLTIDDIISTGTDIYESYQEQETAEERRKAAEAAAAAAQVQASATAAAVAATAAASSQNKVLGIPMSYLMIGGVGLGLVALVIGLTKK